MLAEQQEAFFEELEKIAGLRARALRAASKSMHRVGKATKGTVIDRTAERAAMGLAAKFPRVVKGMDRVAGKLTKMQGR